MYLVYGKKENTPERDGIGIRNQGATINQEGRNHQVPIIVYDLYFSFTN